MNKRQFFTKALLASLPVAADMLHLVPDDAAAENVRERSFAGKIAEEPTLVFETQIIIWNEMDAQPAKQIDPDYVASRRNLVNGIGSGGED